MAVGSRLHTFEVSLSDIDRGVYETLSLTAAQHASETTEYLVARVLALALLHEEHIAFSRGLNAADEPAVWTKDLTGRLRTWIDVGTPDAARLHKASKAADRVVVVCHKQADAWLSNLASATIHQASSIEIVLLDRTFVAELAACVARRNTWTVTRTEGTLYVDAGEASFVSALGAATLD